MEELLAEAIKRNDVNEIKLLISAPLNIKASNNFAIRFAACYGYYDTVKLLIEHGADIKASNDYAIRYAACNGHYDIVKLLVLKGAHHKTAEWYLQQNIWDFISSHIKLQEEVFSGRYENLLRIQSKVQKQRSDFFINLRRVPGDIKIIFFVIIKNGTVWCY